MLIWVFLLFNPFTNSESFPLESKSRSLEYCNIYWKYYVDSSGVCQSCDPACGTCNGPTAFDCQQCDGSYQKIDGICLKTCPLGYTAVSNICVSQTSTGLVYNLNLSLISNFITETVKVGSNVIQITAGNSSEYYPYYDYYDPYAIYLRGFYFDQHAYFSNQDYNLVFAPTFTLGIWLKTMVGSACIFDKQFGNTDIVGLYLKNFYPAVNLYAGGSQSFQGTVSLQNNTWEFLMVKVLLTGEYARISITVGTTESISSNLTSFFNDNFAVFSVTTGANLVNSQYSNFFKGYLWSFTLYNLATTYSSFIQTSGCNSCSYCPLNNNNTCISDCTYHQYIENATCFECSSTCQIFGCVRDDKKCNLCADQKCLICDAFTQTCTQCVNNAYLNETLGQSCVCNYNYIWDTLLEECRPCSVQCAVCNGGGYLGCSQCKPGYYMISGLCAAYCPTGYTIGNDNATCVLTGSSKILDLKLSAIQNVIYDSASNIPVVAGSSDTVFYPNYQSDDPIPAYMRGYYFTGTSLMHFAPFLTYLTPFLSFSPICFIGIWLNPTSSNGIIFSSVSTTLGYTTILEFGINSQYPYITLALSLSSSSTNQTYPTYTSLSQISLNSWSFVVFSIYLDSHEITYITCSINSLAQTQYNLGSGHLTDFTTGNSMLLGTSQTGAGTFSAKYYKGYLYHIIVDTNLANANSDYSTSCSSGCSSCPSGGTCLGTCSVTQYVSSTGSCLNCDPSCTTGCRNASTCSLCDDSGCKVCSDFVGNCTLYNCNPGFYRLPSMTNCSACDPTCATCTSGGPTACSSCVNGYLIQGSCHSFCPTGFSVSGNSCTLTSQTVVNLDLSQIKAVVSDSASGFLVLAGNSTTFYPTFNTFDPWPIQNRGYYFYPNSYLEFPPNIQSSTGLLLLGKQFTISMWVNSERDGIIFAKVDSAYTNYFSICISKYVSVSILLTSGNYNVSASIPMISNWNYVGVSVTFNSSNITSVVFYVNNLTQTVAVGSGYYNDVTSNFHIKIGGFPSLSSTINGWTGTLNTFKVYSISISPQDYSSKCDTSQFSCLFCPTSTNACINSCKHNSWYDGHQCNTCAVFSYGSCVRQDPICNLCYDVQCLICNSFLSGACSQCKANATLNSGSCTCNAHFYWDNTALACLYCDPMQKVMLQGVCLSNCPTGYTNSSGNCVGNSGKIFEIVMDNIIAGVVVDGINGKIQVQTGISPSFYPYYDLTDPYAGKDRGYYFNGYSSYMIILPNTDNQYQLVLGPQFSIGIWMYPVNFGVVYARQSNGYQGLIIELLSNYTVKVSVALQGSSSVQSYVSSTVLTSHSWNYVGITFALFNDMSTQVTVQVNNVAEFQSLIGNTPYEDLSSFVSVIGAKYNTTLILNSYFAGYIRSISVWNTKNSLLSQISTSCSGSCKYCPASTSTCLASCDLSFYYSGSCQSCSNGCSNGCVRGNDCNLCYDRLCFYCANYTATGCTQCVDGASMIQGVCTCVIGSALTAPNGNLYCSTKCMQNCATCTSQSNGDCLTCNSGFYLAENGLCVRTCPRGTSVLGSFCQSIGNMEVLHYVFNMTVNAPPDYTAQLLAFMGSSSNYAPNYDANDPISVYGRGIYFANSAKYVSLPANLAETRNVILGNTHSIKFWIRPTSNQIGCLLVKELSGVKYIYVYLDATLKPWTMYSVSSVVDNSQFTFAASGRQLLLNVWQTVVVVFQRSAQATTSTIYVNGIPGAVGIGNKAYFNDDPSYLFKLGYSVSDGTSYQGFIYELVIYNYAVSPLVPSTCACGVCTESWFCLSSCSLSQYIDSSNQCQSCPGSCTNSCVNSLSCSANKDPLCSNFTGFEISDCTGCIALATKTSNGCQCVPNTIATVNSCTCINNYELYEGVCVPCFYSIQSGDIEAYFSANYFSLVFVLKFEVQNSVSSDCSKLFDQNSFGLLGSGAVCAWNSNFTILTVTLGQNPQVINEEITFQGDLITNIQQCGVNRGPVSVMILEKYPKPVSIPEAVIHAPEFYYTQCGDLTISGDSSQGGYGRPLTYLWTFESSPAFSLFSNASQSSLYFSNSSLTVTTTLNVTLTVTNWLNYTNSTWKIVNIIEGIGISLSFDSSIDSKLTIEISKTIYVMPQSNCGLSNDLSYTWSLTSYSGVDAFINTNLLWSSQKTQSKLYIPAGSLGPGVYLFTVVVTDNVFHDKGEAQISLTVAYSDLQVVFSPEYLSVQVTQDYILPGSAAVDPDGTSATSEFVWSCSNGTWNCSNLISDRFIEEPYIFAGGMSAGSLYVFSLSFVKGSRSAFGTLTVSAVDTSTFGVGFESVPLYINNQENFVIKTNVLIECNCSYVWSLVSGPSISFSNGVHSKDLGITPYSMQSGALYTVQLEMSEGSKSSVFRKSFRVDIPPTGGSLSVDKSEGTALVTVFQLNAPDWYDPKDKTLPLTYQFGYYLGGNVFYINMRNESSVFFTTLPQSSNLKLFVRVYDVYGVFSEANTLVQVSPSSLSLSDFIQSTSDLIKIAWLDPDTLPSSLNLLYLAVNSNTNSSQLLTAAYNASVSIINTLESSLVNIDFGKIDVLLQMVNTTADYNLGKSNKTGLFQLLQSITQVIYENSVIMSQPRAQSFVGVISNIVVLNASTVVSDTQDLYQINEAIKSLAVASSITMGQSQFITFGNDFIKSHYEMLPGDQVTSFSTLPSFNQSFISIPRISKFSFNSSVTILAVFTTYNTLSGLYNTSSEYSSAVDFSIYMIYNQTQIYLTLDFKPFTINLTIPVWNLEVISPRCAYLDLYDWSNSGCNFVEMSQYGSVCGCSHLSLYSSGSHLGETSEGSGEVPIVLIIVLLLALLWLFLAFCLCIKDRKEAESKVFVDKILAGLPPVAGKKEPRYLFNPVADQLGKDSAKDQDRSEHKKDSQYIPPSKIGVIGSYFDDNYAEKKNADEFRISDAKNYRGSDSQKIKVERENPFPESRYEEMKETDLENEERDKKYKNFIDPFQGFKASDSVLPANELSKDNKFYSSGPRLRGVQAFEPNAGVSDLKNPQISSQFQPPKPLNIKPIDSSEPKGSKMPEVSLKLPYKGPQPLEIDPESEPLGPNPDFSPSKSPKVPLGFKISDFSATDSQALQVRLSEAKRQGYQPIKIEGFEAKENVTDPNSEQNSPIVGVVDSYFEHRDPRFKKTFQDKLVIEDVEKTQNVNVGSGEVAGGEPKPTLSMPLQYQAEIPKPLEEEKQHDHTQLFTQPDSPHNSPRFRKKQDPNQEVPHFYDEDDVRKYSPWIADYYFSALMFYHVNYSRFSRLAQGVCAFMMQTLFIGIILAGMGNEYADKKGNNLQNQARNLVFQDVAISFSMAIVANLLVGAVICCFFRTKSINPHLSETERNFISKKNKINSWIGSLIVLFIIIATVVFVGIIEFSMDMNFTILWVICMFISFILDFFLLQILKVIIYNCYSPMLILPDN